MTVRYDGRFLITGQIRHIFQTETAPVANFTGTPVSGGYPLTVNFTDTSQNSPTSWAWDFTNDGSTDSTQQNPSHTYNTAGTYSVKLTATNGAGTSTVTKTNYITVTEPPTQAFGFSFTAPALPIFMGIDFNEQIPITFVRST